MHFYNQGLLFSLFMVRVGKEARVHHQDICACTPAHWRESLSLVCHVCVCVVYRLYVLLHLRESLSLVPGACACLHVQSACVCPFPCSDQCIVGFRPYIASSEDAALCMVFRWRRSLVNLVVSFFCVNMLRTPMRACRCIACLRAGRLILFVSCRLTFR